jgi:hypothetical protein
MWYGGRGGNGGLSIRRGDAMIECAEGPAPGGIPNEDG